MIIDSAPGIEIDRFIERAGRINVAESVHGNPVNLVIKYSAPCHNPLEVACRVKLADMRPLQKSRNSYKYGFCYASNRLETKMLVVYIIDNYLHKMAFATVSI